MFSLQIFASGSSQIKKISKYEVTYTVNKIWSCPSLFIGSNTLTRLLGSLQDKSVCLVCSIHYLCGIYPDIANTRDDYSLSLSFSVVQQTNSVLGRLISEFSVSHTHTTLQGWSVRRRGRYLHNTQHSQQKNIHAISRIRTRDPSDQAAADRLRQRGQRDRPTKSLTVHNN